MSYKLRIVTPEGILFDDQVEKLVAHTVLGDICILANHIDIVTVIDVGKVSLSQGDKTRYAACSGGVLSVRDGECSLVATTFEYAEDIDAARAQIAKDRAEEKLKNQLETKQQALYKAKLQRALCRLNVSGMISHK